jgi:uncharacterized protein (DUF433 family)
MQPEREHIIDLDTYIENRLMSGRPHIKGRRVPVNIVVGLADVYTVSQVADDLSISVDEVLAALLYYQQHKAEVDALEAEDIAFHTQQSAKKSEKFRHLGSK